MNEATRVRLLELNRAFYATVATPFDATRQVRTPGKTRLVAQLSGLHDNDPLRVLDVGCGNGRLAFMLEDLGYAVDYVGIDGSPALLAFARDNTHSLQHVQSTFVEADLSEPDWVDAVTGPFDAVVCLATLQHFPSYGLRRQLMTQLGELADDDGLVVVSAWQFLDSERLRARRLPWAEAGIDATQVEPGDALLSWKQDVYAIRYVHQTDASEFARLAADAGLRIVDSFRADGRTNDLNLYVLMQLNAPM
jgi:SAM-dependent methyltransferase